MAEANIDIDEDLREALEQRKPRYDEQGRRVSPINGLPPPEGTPFKKGHDPRRFVPGGNHRRMTLAEHARKLTHKGLKVIEMVLDGVDDEGNRTDYPIKDRVRAAEIVFDRGYGRSVSVVDMKVVSEAETDVTRIKTVELMRLLSEAKNAGMLDQGVLDALPSEDGSFAVRQPVRTDEDSASD